MLLMLKLRLGLTKLFEVLNFQVSDVTTGRGLRRRIFCCIYMHLVIYSPQPEDVPATWSRGNLPVSKAGHTFVWALLHPYASITAMAKKPLFSAAAPPTAHPSSSSGRLSYLPPFGPGSRSGACPRTQTELNGPTRAKRTNSHSQLLVSRLLQRSLRWGSPKSHPRQFCPCSLSRENHRSDSALRCRSCRTPSRISAYD